MFKLFIPLLVLWFMSFDNRNCQMINLQSDYSQYIVGGRDPQFTYVDSYFNNCISKIDFCTKGIIGAFNLTVLYAEMNENTDAGYEYGRIVLYSTGAESPYSRGGVYLHQINARGDKYLEFGFTNRDDLFTTRMYLTEGLSRISYIWDRTTVKVYVDGILHENIQTPKKRAYLDLFFNPFKTYKFFNGRPKTTSINQIWFIESLLDKYDNIARGEESDYMIGCYDFITPPTIVNNLLYDSTKAYFMQCKELCKIYSHKYALLNEDKCTCLENEKLLKEQLIESSCSNPSSWHVLIATSVHYDLPYTTLDLEVERVILRTPIEIGDPIGIQIKSKTDSNYLLSAAFSSSNTKKLIGNNFIFEEYYEMGVKNINITAYSLTDPKRSFQRVVQFNINALIDREPMHAVNIKVDIKAEKTVLITVNSAGGLPYSCLLNTGDSNKLQLDPTSRIQTFIRNYTYAFTGIYNITVNCVNKNGVNNEVFKSMLIYLPDQTKTNFYSVFDNSYFTKTYTQIILPRPSSNQNDIEFFLPFATTTQNLTLRVIDPFDKDNKLEVVNNASPKVNHSLSLKIKTAMLKNLNENYFQIICEDLVLASYLIVLEDQFDVPKIQVINRVLVENSPVYFDITLNRTTNTIVKIEYGDGDVQFFQMLQTTKLDSTPYVLKLNHTYKSGLNFYVIKVSVANHLNRLQASKEMTFETSLPLFQLKGVSEIQDISQTASFRLSTEPQNDPVRVENVLVIFEENNKRLFRNYTFAKNNSFSLEFTNRFSSYGYFNVIVNCSNQISYQIATFRIKVGIDLNTATAIVVNSYANVYERVYLKINVNGGNGYNVSIDFDDGKQMVLTWKYLITNGTAKENLPGFVRPNAMFNNSGVYVYYQYSLPAIYNPKIQVINPFKEISAPLCAKIEVASEPKIQTNETMDPYCFVSPENIDLYINNVTVKYEQLLKIAKGIPNILHTSFALCTDPYLNQLITRWVIMRVPVGKSTDFEEELSGYCMIQSQNNSLLIDANQLEFGNYSLRVYSYRADQPENYVQHGVYMLKVETSPIKVNLNDGLKSFELHLDQPLYLTFYEKTYDPDSKVLGDKTDFLFYFVCVQNSINRTDFIKSIQNTMFSLDTNITNMGMNLAFYNDEYKIWFYETECFLNMPSADMDAEMNPIKITDKSLSISGNSLLLNQSLTMSLQLYVQKKTRISVSQQLLITMNMSKLFAISLESNFKQINDQLTKLNDLAQRNPHKALNILTGFVEVVNMKAGDPVHNQTNATENEADPLTEFSNIRNRMLGTVGGIVDRVYDGDSILTAAKTVGSVASNPDQMPASNQETGSFAIEKMGDKAKNLGSESPELITEIASSILGATGNTFDAAVRTVPVVESNFTDPGLLEPEEEKPPVILPAKISAPLELYQCEDCEDFPDEVYEEQLVQEEIQFQKEEDDRKKTAEVAKRTFNGISGAGLALAASSSNGSNNTNMTKIESKGMALIVGKKSLNDTENESETEFSTGDGLSILMPVVSNVVNKSNSSLPPAIVTSMIASSENPLQSSKSKASGMIVSLKLTDDFGNPIVVNNTQEPFNIKIPSSTPAPSFKAYVNRTAINYHKLYLATNSSSLHVVVIPDNPGDFYHIYIKYSVTKVTTEYPDEHNYDYHFTLPDLYAIDTDPNNELMYTAFISNNDTKGNGTYYIGVKLVTMSNETRTMLNETNSTDYISYYTVRIFSTSCKYWKEENNEWSTDGCYVGPNTVYNLTECLCYHLTTFGTDFYVPPNTIDFSTVFGKFKNLSENAAVFATVVSLIGVYILIGIYVRWKDKKDLIKWGATPLSDNLPTDTYYYLISVQTGVGKSAGTTSKVGFVLSGDQSDSGVRKLTDDKRKAFKSGSICNFIMSVEEPLGSLQYLRIWHDNSGKGNSKSWYLNTVTILDLQTNQKSSFVCNQWFAVERDDGQIDRVIPEACQSDLISFKHLFTQSVKKKFTDNHLWFSVFARPTKSSFTRLQRLSCCMSLLFTTMIANAMFYKSESNAKNTSGLMEIGPIKFSMSQLYTSVISSLIVVPVNVIIVTLFRKAKLKRKTLIKSRKTGHIAKQQYWRRVKQIENIELPENDHVDHSSYFNIDNAMGYSRSDFGSRDLKQKKSM